jgi:hypothetical protein
MKLGQIYFWETDQAIGHKLRDKYHLYICPPGWRTQGHAFLFINKRNYGGDYAISKTDYPFMPLEVSYVSTSAIVTYSDGELSDAKIRHVGDIKPKHLGELHNSIANSDVMEGWEIELVCKHLRRFLDSS